jgi:hypothetical protein
MNSFCCSLMTMFPVVIHDGSIKIFLQQSCMFSLTYCLNRKLNSCWNLKICRVRILTNATYWPIIGVNGLGLRQFQTLRKNWVTFSLGSLQATILRSPILRQNAQVSTVNKTVEYFGHS